MYKVVIVEDEDLIRNGLMYAIPWSDMDCAVVGSGRNGVEGIEQIQKHNPEIVLLDINMPIMSGLKMLESTYRDYCYSAIILSGYSDFEYAQDAMQYGAVRYILKPIDREELAEAVNEAKEKYLIRQNWISSKQSTQDLRTLQVDLRAVDETENDEVVAEMLNFIQLHYAEKIVLQDVEKMLNYSATFLNKRFKKQMGTTFIEYLNRYRIQRALDMIKEGKLKLQDISWKCGIGDYKYFTVVFKKYIGCAPKEYAQAIKSHSR